METASTIEQDLHDFSLLVKQILFVPDLVRNEREQVHHQFIQNNTPYPVNH
jgi:hypothetical protein